MPDPSGTDVDREWFEIYNAGATPIDLTGYAAGDGLVQSNTSTGEGMGAFPSGTIIQPGQFMIIAARASGFNSFVAGSFPHAKADFEFLNGTSTIPEDPNTPNVTQKPGWGAASGAAVGMQNTADDVGILDPSNNVVDMVSYGGAGTMVSWTDAANATIQRRPANVDTDTGADWQYVTALGNSTPGFGQRLFWDIDGTGTAGGGGATPSGNWDGVTANFNTDSAGAGTTTLATTSTLHKVTFTAGSDGGGAYTVTVSGTQVATILDIARGDVTFNGGTIATGQIAVATGAVSTINSVIAGGVTGKLVKSGPGTLTLGGANTYTNGTSVEGGILNAASALALGGATNPLAVSNPNVGAGTAVTLNLFTGGATSVGSLSGAIAIPSSGTNTATINNPVGLNVTQAADGTFDGAIAGAGGLTKTGAAQLALSGTNTYTGGTAVNAGTLKAVKPVSLSEYATPGKVSVASGATLLLSAGASNWTDTAINDAYAAATFAAGSRLALDTSSADFTYGFAMGKANGLTKQGINKLTLTAASTYTGGTTVSGGTLVIGHADAIGVGSLNVADGALAQAQAGLPKAVTVTTLTTNTSGKLDVANNSMVIKGTADSAVRTQLQAGYNAGGWNGASGIISTSVTPETSIGYATQAQTGITDFKGVTGLAGTDVLVKFTYAGDANLDGKVDIGDLGLLAGAWQAASGKVWFDGDFTYDGAVDIGDLGLLSGNWQKGTAGNPNPPLMDFATAMAQFSAFDGVVVPEPASLSVLALGGIALGRRRRASVPA